MKIYFAETIKNLRLQKKLTQEQLADVFCVSPQAVSRWACGTTTPDITLLPVIADYFEVTLEEDKKPRHWNWWNRQHPI